MATLVDVQNALAEIVQNAVYPNGIGQPSIAGTDIIIYPGWPNPAKLQADMAQGKIQISIYKMRGMERNVKAFPSEWFTISINEETGTAIRELKRQEQAFMITIWAPTHLLRDLVGDTTDAALTAAVRLNLPNGESEFLLYHSMNESDDMQKATVYRRDLIYSIEYATTQTRTFDVVTGIEINTTYPNSIS